MPLKPPFSLHTKTKQDIYQIDYMDKLGNRLSFFSGVSTPVIPNKFFHS